MADSKLKIIPLGGLEQIGMNITVFEYEDSIIVVDLTQKLRAGIIQFGRHPLKMSSPVTYLLPRLA